MFSNKKMIVKNPKYLKLNISTFSNGMNTEIDENILPFKFAKTSYNFSVKKGALENGLGFKKLCLPNGLYSPVERELVMPEGIQEVYKIYFLPHYDLEYDRHRNVLLLYCEDNRLYWCRTESASQEFTAVSNTTLDNIPKGIVYNLDGEDVMIFCSAGDGMASFQPEEPFTIDSTAPNFVSLCKHYERIFAIEEGRQSKIVFSANLDPTNWDMSTDAGYIELFDERGQLLKVVSFDDYVYVFREKGITRISAYGDQSEFNVTQMYLTSDKIYGNSVCVCGDRIFFLTKNGLYSFDGNYTKKVQLNIETMFKSLDNRFCTSAYYDGKLYIACNLDFGDSDEIGAESYVGGYYNNSLIEYDFKEGDLNILRGVDIMDLCVIDSGDTTKLAACFYNRHRNKLGELTKDGMVFGEALPSTWTSSYSNLGYPNRKKIVKEIHFNSKYDCKVKVKTENIEKTFLVKGSDVTSKIKTNISCEMFQISFISEIGNAKISCPQIVLGLV